MWIRRKSERYGTLLAVFLAVGLLSACDPDLPDVGVTASDIADDPSAYYGELVTVSGEVDEVWGPHAFKLGGNEFESGVLVFSSAPVSVATAADGQIVDPLEPGDVVQVTGVVREFTMADVEAEYDFDVESEVETEYETLPGVFVNADEQSRAGVAVTPRQDTAAVDTAETDTTTVSADTL